MARLRKVLKIVSSSMLIAITLPTSAHEDHRKEMVEAVGNMAKKLDSVNLEYSRSVRAIFEKKCFDCHSSRTNFPWYASIPGIKQWIESDIINAKKHMEMDRGFPFKSHADPMDDLNAISESVATNKMPPWRYRILHPSAALSSDEKIVVSQWVLFGRKILNEKLKTERHEEIKK